MFHSEALEMYGLSSASDEAQNEASFEQLQGSAMQYG